MWVAIAATVALAQGESEDFRGFLDQARFFVRKEWYEDAREQLELAVAHPDGRVDPEAWYMLATVRYELCDLEGARDAAERAHTFSRDDEQLLASAGFSAFLKEQFGVIEVTAPYPGLAARLDVALQGSLIDPALVTYLEKTREIVRKKRVLPQRFGLPAGEYLVNGVPVTVGANAFAEVALEGSQLDVKGPVGAKLTEAEVAMGMAVWAGRELSHLMPAFHAQASVTQPVGPLRAGLMLDWAAVPFLTMGGESRVDPNAVSLGVRAGYELKKAEPFVFRFSAGYRFGLQPGLELRCTEEGDAWRCGEDVPTDVVIYAIGRAHVPLVEVAVHLLDRNRTSGVGFGIKGIAEQAFGTLPEHGEARMVQTEDRLAFTVDAASRTWTATSFRVMVNCAIAF